jgi:hypothetical protein
MTPVRSTAAILALAAATLPAAADEIYATEDPFGSPFGMIGFDVGGPSQQRVGVRFIPDADYRLDRISVWFMSNDFGGVSGAPVRITVETDDPSGGESIPSGEVVDELGFEVSAIGWDPVLEVMDSVRAPRAARGRPLLGRRPSPTSPPRTRCGTWPIRTRASPPSGTAAPGSPAAAALSAPSSSRARATAASATPTATSPASSISSTSSASRTPLPQATPTPTAMAAASLDFFDFLCFQNEFAAGCP